MKKSKVAVAIILAIVLILICVYAPTVSWFTRPAPDPMPTGEMMMLESKDEYPGYNGYNVVVSTNTSPNGTNDSYNTTVTGDGTGSDGFSGSGIGAFNKKYFCSTITNNSSTDQNVSLYISKLSIPTDSQGTLALGVNEPTRSYRDYSSLAHPSFTTTNDTMRVYFEKNNSVNGWNGTDFYICWNEDPNTNSESLNSTGSNGTYTKLQWVGDAGHLSHYYADIPRTATHAFFCVENWGTNNNGNANWGQRSQTFWNLANLDMATGGKGAQTWNTPKLFKVSTNMTGSNRYLEVYNSPGVGIDQYYSSISVAAGNTYDATLQSGWKIGGSVEYYSGDDDIFTVDSNGEITPVRSGEAILYTKVINDNNGYYDSMEVQTVVKVTAAGKYEFNDVPIVKNLKIAGSSSIDVFWYVLNNSGSTLDYTINRVYIGP